MLAVLEMLEEENKRFFRKGEKKAKLEIDKKLLKAKVPMKVIVETTELTEKEIKKLSN